MIADMKIGELANMTGVQVETIRHYEREGLLPHTKRSEGNYRVYDESHGQRLSFIRHCRSLDMTLDEIRVLLRFRDAPTENCGEVNALLDEHIGHVALRVKRFVRRVVARRMLNTVEFSMDSMSWRKNKRLHPTWLVMCMVRIQV